MALTRTKAAVQAHPAGATTGVSGVLGAFLISYFHLDPQQAGAVCAAIGLVGTAVSWVNAHNGVMGLWNDLVHGNGG